MKTHGGAVLLLCTAVLCMQGAGRKEGSCCCVCWGVRGATEAVGQMRCRKNLLAM